jgi:hypothetical protein
VRYVTESEWPWNCTGAIDLDAAIAAMATSHPEIRACYERALARDPALSGRVVIAMRVSDGGAVDDVDVRSEWSDGETLECMRAAARATHFPPPSPSGTCAVISAPMNFRPRARATTQPPMSE